MVILPEDYLQKNFFHGHYDKYRYVCPECGHYLKNSGFCRTKDNGKTREEFGVRLWCEECGCEGLGNSSITAFVDLCDHIHEHKLTQSVNALIRLLSRFTK